MFKLRFLCQNRTSEELGDLLVEKFCVSLPRIHLFKEHWVEVRQREKNKKLFYELETCNILRPGFYLLHKKSSVWLNSKIPSDENLYFEKSACLGYVMQ
jgi:predicted DNA-binding protein (MmcQ/YjbR family)